MFYHINALVYIDDKKTQLFFPAQFKMTDTSPSYWIRSLCNHANLLLLTHQVEAADFKAIKMECENSIRRLEAKLTEVNSQPLIRTRIEKVIEKVVNALSDIDQRYYKAEPQHKAAHGVFIVS